jgi:hypothetical protein
MAMMIINARPMNSPEDRADRCRTPHECRGQRARVAGSGHCRHEHDPGCRRIGRSGAGYAGHQHVGDHRNLAQAAGQAPDEGLGKFDQPFGDACGQHQLAQEHEQRHRQDDERIQPVEHPLDDHAETGIAELRHPRHAGQAEGHGDRHAERKQQQHGAEQDRGYHASLLRSPGTSSRQSRCTAMYAPAIGITR